MSANEMPSIAEKFVGACQHLQTEYNGPEFGPKIRSLTTYELEKHPIGVDIREAISSISSTPNFQDYLLEYEFPNLLGGEVFFRPETWPRMLGISLPDRLGIFGHRVIDIEKSRLLMFQFRIRNLASTPFKAEHSHALIVEKLWRQAYNKKYSQKLRDDSFYTQPIESDILNLPEILALSGSNFELVNPLSSIDHIDH